MGYAQVEGVEDGKPSRPLGFRARLTPDAPPGSSMPPPDFEVVQRAGEMVVFPGHWWHQVYHYGDTVALASQYCNDRILQRVLGHVLDWCGVTAGVANLLLQHVEHESPTRQIEEALG